MKVSSVFIVAAAIITGQASAELGRRGRRGHHSTKQRNAVKGEDRRLQENEATGENDGEGKGSKSASKSKGKGKTCSIKDMGGLTYVSLVDVIGVVYEFKNMGGLTYFSWRPPPAYPGAYDIYRGYVGNGVPLTMSFAEFRMPPVPPVPLAPPAHQGMGAMDVKVCFEISNPFPPPSPVPSPGGSYTLTGVQTGLSKDNSFPFTLTYEPIGSMYAVRVDWPGTVIVYSAWSMQGEFDCETGAIMFGGNGILNQYSLATIDPVQPQYTDDLSIDQATGCLDSPAGSR